MHAMPNGLSEFRIGDLPPVCGRWRDSMPKERNSGVYVRYMGARRLLRSKIEWQLTKEELEFILSTVQLSAQQGDWGARALLASFYRDGLGPLSSNNVLEADPQKAVDIARVAIAAGQAWGYHDLGVAYENGYGGVPYDPKIAWAYYLKAAKLGSPEAQMALAQAYSDAKQPEAAMTMRMCAYQQGHGPAANKLGSIANAREEFGKAIAFYQDGVKFGSEDAAAALFFYFDASSWFAFEKAKQEALRNLGIIPDAERSRRYWEIRNALHINPDLRLTRIDQYLPLPPASIPPWNGFEDAVEADAVPSYR